MLHHFSFCTAATTHWFPSSRPVHSWRLRDVSTQPVVYAELPFTQHAFDMLGSARAVHAAIAVEQFLAEIHPNAG